MAPLCNLLLRLLAYGPSGPEKSGILQPELDKINQQQQPVSLIHSVNDKNLAVGTEPATISATSWGKNRLDVFGLTGHNLTHKFWDGGQWIPSGDKLETLGNGLRTSPVAVTWGVDRLDIFGLDDDGVIKHQYWDGTGWRPDIVVFENLGRGCSPNYTPAVNTWGPDRLDIFCIGPKGDLLHQYYDGSQWQPSAGSLESLGGFLASDPSVVSWGPNRLDVFAVDYNSIPSHLYWDGTQWSKWEQFPSSPNAFGPDTLTVTSWGLNRLDLYGVTLQHKLLHLYWDGSSWSSWEDLGGDGKDQLLTDGVAAASWSANRLDIVAIGDDGKYWYKYYDGQSWQPDVSGWYGKGSDAHFNSTPSVISWGENRLDIFGSSNGALLHQAWAETSWFPSSTGWEVLGNELTLIVDDDAKASHGSRPLRVELRP